MKFNVAIKTPNSFNKIGRELDALDGAPISVSGCWTGLLSPKDKSIAWTKGMATLLISSSFKLDALFFLFAMALKFMGGCMVILHWKNRGYTGASWKRVAHDIHEKGTELLENVAGYTRKRLTRQEVQASRPRICLKKWVQGVAYV